jgi:dTMP kinase
MYKKKFLFITFEGIEGSGKSYQSKILYKKLKKLKIPVSFTREPGGSKSAEKIRKLILSGEKNKFTKTTDTLLYLASRNEHIEQKLKKLIYKSNIISDRFTDSTLAYQVGGRGVSKELVNSVHKNILQNLSPDITIILKVTIKKAFSRMKKRKFSNRYDKFSKAFYEKVQNSFVKLSKTNKRRYFVVNNNQDTLDTEEIIFKKIISLIKK